MSVDYDGPKWRGNVFPVDGWFWFQSTGQLFMLGRRNPASDVPNSKPAPILWTCIWRYPLKTATLPLQKQTTLQHAAHSCCRISTLFSCFVDDQLIWLHALSDLLAEFIELHWRPESLTHGFLVITQIESYEVSLSHDRSKTAWRWPGDFLQQQREQVLS